MNKIPLNIAGLDGGVIIKKGGGGGVTINNQEKSLDITENGVTEVTADAGFTGLSKVIVNTNVASSGGGGGSDMPVIGDGKTYLYITIAAEGRMDVPLYFSQSVANGVTIDWGDGSPTETLSGTGSKNTTHKYAAIGNYVISLDPVDGCTLGLGHNSSSYCVMGRTGNNDNKAYCNMLKMAEIGKGFTKIDNYALYECYSLSSVVIPEGVTTIGDYSFGNCYALASIAIPSSVTKIGNYAFRLCTSLASVTIPEGVTSIGKQAFYNCYSLSSIVMSSGIKSTGIEAFYGCYSLSSIVIPSGITSLANSFLKSCYSLSSVVIPEGVTTIGDYSFGSCFALASIAIPSSVTSIGAFAFSGCFGMAFCDFSQHKAVPASGMVAFNSVPNFKIIVPDALYDEWIAATNWSSYASNIIKKSDWDAQS